MSGLGLWRLALGTAAAFGHELVEFGLVRGMRQTVEELLEFALFLPEAAQGLRAVLVKGTVAARARPPAPPSARVRLAALLPVARAATCPARHSPAAYEIPQNDEAERPPNHKTHYREGHPGWIAEIVQFCRECHGEASCECMAHLHGWGLRFLSRRQPPDFGGSSIRLRPRK